MGKRIYLVRWENEALEQLYSLVSFELAEKIYEEVNNILAINPYGKLKDIKVNINGWKTNIKSLDENLEGSWRIRVGDYRVLYDVFESEILVSIFRFKDRSNEFVYSDKDFVNN